MSGLTSAAPASGLSRRSWPVVLRHGPVELRPLRLRDMRAWKDVRLRNRDWLMPWEPTGSPSWAARHTTRKFLQLRRDSAAAAREDRMLPFVMWVDGSFAGQVNVGPIQRGAASSADIGYWVDRQLAGRGLTPIAVALAIRHSFEACGLHRVHAAIRPENAASLRVADKLGMRLEASYERYLNIDGGWRDHLGYALTADDDLTRLHAVLS